MEGARDERRRQQGEERHQFHRDVADQEVDSVSGPTGTKSALLRIQRKQALQGDENDGEQHDVQDKPVEPDPERRRAAADFDGASAGKDRRHTEEEAGQPEPLGRPKQDIEGRKQKTCDDGQRQDHAHGLDGIARRRLRGGQPMRIAEHKHRQKTSQAEEHSEHTGQPAGPKVLRQAVPKEGFHPPIQLGLAVWRRRRVRLVGGHVDCAITLVSHPAHSNLRLLSREERSQFRTGMSVHDPKRTSRFSGVQNTLTQQDVLTALLAFVRF